MPDFDGDKSGRHLGMVRMIEGMSRLESTVEYCHRLRHKLKVITSWDMLIIFRALYRVRFLGRNTQRGRELFYISSCIHTINSDGKEG